MGTPSEGASWISRETTSCFAETSRPPPIACASCSPARYRTKDGTVRRQARRRGREDRRARRQVRSLDIRLGGQLADQLEPLADELRSRPGHIEIQETLAKIVDAAQSDVATQLGSLEETVLTLAEALLRPHTPQIPAPREASREASREGSRDDSREGSRI
jgi:hypothetical protein